jgi:RNA polymerase sigma-70 factor (ECF subfamily)
VLAAPQALDVAVDRLGQGSITRTVAGWTGGRVGDDRCGHGVHAARGAGAPALSWARARRRRRERRAAVMVDEAAIRTWLEAARAGDRYAAQKLILAHHPRLHRLAQARLSPRLRARVDADDLLQQVYVEVVRRIAEFELRGPGSFYEWLTTMLDSRIVDAQRRHHARKRDVARERSGAGGGSTLQRWLGSGALDTRTPSRAATAREQAASLHAALAGLPDDHRRVLELRYLQARSLEETARELERSVPAAQMLCLRALRGLRRSMRDLSRAAD